jgi:aromatic ring hydroxylase-like protein
MANQSISATMIATAALMFWVSARCEWQPADALLIRPDGYIAWATSADSDPGSHRVGLRHAFVTWFGSDPVEPWEDDQEADAPLSPP